MKKAFLIVTALLLVLAVYAFYSSPAPAFSAFYDAVQEGMSQSEVQAELVQHFPAGGRFHQPQASTNTPGFLCYTLDPNDGRYNAEIIAFEMSDGKVVSKKYYPD